MTHKIFTRKTLFAVIFGIAAMAFIGLLVNLLTFYVSSMYMQSISLQPARSIVTSPDYIRNTRFILTLSFIGMILGGVIAGYFSQKRGWIAGILVGLVSISFSLILLLCSLLFKDVIFTSKIPDKLVNIKLMASFIQILKSIPTTLFCTALGGYIGEMIWQRKSHK